MVSEQRQRVIETNRSLRLIKNVGRKASLSPSDDPISPQSNKNTKELESLLEKGIITESAFDNIQSLLPTESSLSAAAPTQATPSQRTPAPTSQPPTSSLASLSISPPPGPPSYSQSTGNNNGGGPPPLPTRNQPSPPPPTKPVIARARALYRYAASDARDCSFERDDRVEVHEYMNADWWMGRNARTGAEGIFPKNYVEVEPEAAAASPSAPAATNEKAGGGWNTGNAYPCAYGHGAAAGSGYVPPAQPMYGGNNGYPPPPPGQVNPYNSQAPPMAVAEQGQGSGESKVGGAGKKIGKKLGNAAIFGAGATIGSNIVNSIF
jgi:hypothetical protein